jgi:hypothetical protein
MTRKWFWDPLCIARAWHCILILEARFIFIWSHFGLQKKKSMSKFQNLQCKRVCNPWVSNTLAVYLDFLPFLDFFLECFFLVFSGGGFIQREIIQTVKNLRWRVHEVLFLRIEGEHLLNANWPIQTAINTDRTVCNAIQPVKRCTSVINKKHA